MEKRLLLTLSLITASPIIAYDVVVKNSLPNASIYVDIKAGSCTGHNGIVLPSEEISWSINGSPFFCRTTITFTLPDSSSRKITNYEGQIYFDVRYIDRKYEVRYKGSADANAPWTSI